jgi:penicillin-binding protein-related factor A (putative recombinase)
MINHGKKFEEVIIDRNKHLKYRYKAFDILKTSPNRTHSGTYIGKGLPDFIGYTISKDDQLALYMFELKTIENGSTLKKTYIKEHQLRWLYNIRKKMNAFFLVWFVNEFEYWKLPVTDDVYNRYYQKGKTYNREFFEEHGYKIDIANYLEG